jgi:hypothetical protein
MTRAVVASGGESGTGTRISLRPLGDDVEVGADVDGVEAEALDAEPPEGAPQCATASASESGASLMTGMSRFIARRREGAPFYAWPGRHSPARRSPATASIVGKERGKAF